MYHKDYFDNKDEINFKIESINELDAVLDTIIEPSEVTREKLHNQEEKLLRMMPSNIWNIHIDGNMELKMEQEFSHFMFSVKEHTGIEIKNMSVGKFYRLLEYLKTKNEDNGGSRSNI